MAHARESAVAERFDFLGRISDERLVELYRECDAVIVPSMAEGGAYIPLEAIVAGKPVAVNDIDAARAHVASVGGEVIWFDGTDAEATAPRAPRMQWSRKWMPSTITIFGSSSSRGWLSHSPSFCSVNATNRRETALFEVDRCVSVGDSRSRLRA